MRRRARTALAALAGSLGLLGAGPPAAALAQDPEPEALPASPSPAVAQLAGWAVESGDNNGRPFLVIDKLSAQVFVFDAHGQPLAATPALLGLARGDGSVPGIGERPLSEIRPEERTTPAGRFLAGFGPAAGQGETFWVDFATAVSLHPVVTANPKEQRLKRLRSPSPKDNRITYGCINVPAEFYEGVVRDTFEGQRSVAYVLPDTRPLEEVFPGFQAQASATSAQAEAVIDALHDDGGPGARGARRAELRHAAASGGGSGPGPGPAPP